MSEERRKKTSQEIADEFPDAYAEGEVVGIERLRKEQGDRAWAEQLSALAVRALTLMHSEHIPGDENIGRTGKLILQKQTANYEELYFHPMYGASVNPVTAGLIRELANRRYIDLDVEDLYKEKRKVPESSQRRNN